MTVITSRHFTMLIKTILALTVLALLPASVSARETQPNILVIWGDDIGVYNVSAYHRGLLGGRTPNIDRIAHDGSQTFTYPDGGAEPFRGAKGSTWEGGFRVPLLVKWPGVVKPGTVINDIFHHMDWFPTLANNLGYDDVAGQLKRGLVVGDTNYRVHLDGFDQTALLAG